MQAIAFIQSLGVMKRGMARGLAVVSCRADRSQMVSQVRCLAHAPETGEALSLLRIWGVIRPLALSATRGAISFRI